MERDRVLTEAGLEKGDPAMIGDERDHHLGAGADGKEGIGGAGRHLPQSNPFVWDRLCRRGRVWDSRMGRNV